MNYRFTCVFMQLACRQSLLQKVNMRCVMYTMILVLALHTMARQALTSLHKYENNN